MRTGKFTRDCSYSEGGSIIDTLIRKYGKYLTLNAFEFRLELFPVVKSLKDFWWTVGIGVYVNDGLIGQVKDMYLNCENLVVEFDKICIMVDLK